MFKNIHLHNFRAFGDLEFNLTGPRDTALDYAVVYGRNASGKTALIQSVEFLKITTISFFAMTRGLEIVDEKNANHLIARNGSLTAPATDISIIARDMMMRNPDGPMTLSYRFVVDERNAEYSMSFSEKDGRLISEKLVYVSSKNRRTEYLSVNRDDDGLKMKLNHEIFPDSDLTSWIRNQADQWWGKQTLLGIVIYGAIIRNRQYMESSSPLLMKLVDYMAGLNSLISGLGGDAGAEIESYPSHGFINSSDRHILDAYESALDRFLTRLDPDLESVYYETYDNGSGRLEYSLCFNRCISGKVRTIRALEESAGVMKLVTLFSRLLGCAHGKVVFIDEFDSGIHDKLICDLFEQMLPDISGQLVITTHNTNLLLKLEPRKSFLLDVDIEGHRSISSVSSIARTHKNNNNRDRYMRGDLGGVPHIGFVDLRNIVDHLEEDLA